MYKKVYCNDCIHGKGSGCFTPDKTEKYNYGLTTPFNIDHSFVFHRNENEDNNCPDYKRKWWKIWV